MCLGHAEPALRPDVAFEPSIHGQPAPVRIVDSQQRRPDVVLFGAHPARDHGIAPVRANHHTRPGNDRRTVRGTTSDPHDTPILRQQIVDMKAFPNLRARLCCCVDKQFVEYGASRTVSHRRILRARRPGDRYRAEVERIRMDRRARRGNQPVEQTPSRQGRDSEWLYYMR